MKKILSHLFEQNILTTQEAKAILLRIGQGEFSDPEIASFLTVFLMRKIEANELAGFREALLELCVPVNTNGLDIIDVCGTGGDEKNTFNISTLTSFVIAGAGYHVVKHGNYAVSSSVGSSNVIEQLGYTFSNDSDKIRRELEQAKICYLHAPFFHPAMKHVANVRKNLKLKTFFNLLGPMVNPARPNKQIVGVFNQEVQELYSKVYQNINADYYLLNSLDGYDEISLTSPFRAISKTEDNIYKPSDIGFSTIAPEALHGSETIEGSAKLFVHILEGNGTKEQQNAVTANAAFGIKCFHPDKSIEECMAIAFQSIESGAAYNALKELLKLQ